MLAVDPPLFDRRAGLVPGRTSDREAQACRALPIPAIRYCSELDAPCKAHNRGGETCAFADAKRVRPPGATRSFFARPRPDRGAGLAGSRARAGERPCTAETGERPTSRSGVRTPFGGNARYMSGVARHHDFPPSARL